jgi:hypothetical protein
MGKKYFQILSIAFLMLLLQTQQLFAQEENEKIPTLIAYEDLNSKLFLSKVLEFKGKKASDLLTIFKNAASVNFVNLKEVIVSESENQITIVYLNKCNEQYYNTLLGKMPWLIQFHTRLVAQTKDEKIRLQFYDDGNAYYQAIHQGDKSINARTIFISDFQEAPKDAREMHRITGKRGGYGVLYSQHAEWQSNILNLFRAIENSMKKEYTERNKTNFDF